MVESRQSPVHGRMSRYAMRHRRLADGVEYQARDCSFMAWLRNMVFEDATLEGRGQHDVWDVAHTSQYEFDKTQAEPHGVNIYMEVPHI